MPRVSGTRSGQGGSRVVPGRTQSRTPPIIGLKRRVSGSEPAPSPSTSQSIVQATAFWKTTGCVHHSPMLPSPPSVSLVAAITSRPPPADASLTQVEEVDRGRRAEPVQRPVLGERLDPFQVRSLAPLLDLERRRCRVQ